MEKKNILSTFEEDSVIRIFQMKLVLISMLNGVLWLE
jgi:hypothetical protein